MHSRDLLVVAERSLRSPQQSQPPASPSAIIPLPAANVTVVRTAEELQIATEAGALDIEIQAHLDLSSLERRLHPTLPTHDSRVSLLYAEKLRSIRGNCSDPDAASALGLSGQEKLLPLKPRQCLVLISDTLLTVIDKAIWVDNVYLLGRPGANSPGDVAFIRVGLHPDNFAGDLLTPASQAFVTNVTFHALQGTMYEGVTTGEALMKVYISECIFTGWQGSRSPLTALSKSVLNVVDTVFHSCSLRVELVDVSWGGIVRFESVWFSGVTFHLGHIVATSYSDFVSVPTEFGSATYLPEDDAQFDVVAVAVPPGAGGPFHPEEWITEAVMSDCVYLWQDGDLMPGCPEAAAAAREELAQRGREYAGADFYAVLEPDSADYAGPPGPLEKQAENGTLRLEERAMAETPWFVLVQEMLGELPPPPPTWPDFDAAVRRVTVSESNQQPAVSLWPSFSPTASAPLPPPARGSPADTSAGGRTLGVPVASGVAVAVVLAVLVALWAVLRHRQKQRVRGEMVERAVRQSGRGPRQSRSGSGRSMLSVVQSRKVEVPETTQMFIATDNTATVLGPGFTAHAQGSAAWSERSDSPLATDHYITGSCKLPLHLELPFRRGNSHSTVLPAQASLPSAARSASTEPASHSAGSDIMHGPAWVAPAAVGGSSCVSPDRTLSGGHAHWTSPAVLLNTESGRIQKSLSGGSPAVLQGGFIRGDSLQDTSEIASSRVLHGSSEIVTMPMTVSTGLASLPLSAHPSETAISANAESASEVPRIKARMGSIGSSATPALCRANSSSSAVMRAPDGVLTLLGDTRGLVLEGSDSQHAQHGTAARQSPSDANEVAPGSAAGNQRSAQHAAQRAQHTDGRMHSAGSGALLRMCSLGHAWEDVVTHGKAADSGPGPGAEHTQHAQHARRSRVPYVEGMEAVAHSGTVDGGDSTVGDADVDRAVLSAAVGAGDSSAFTADARGGASEESGGFSQGIAAQWRDLRRSLRRGRGPAAGAPWLEGADSAASRSLAPPIDVTGSGRKAGGTDDAMRRLARQLDLFGPEDLFLGRFRMLGREQRRRGGQAIVQFAEGSVDTCAYAVKFFLDQEAFHAENALYATCTTAPLDSHRSLSAGVPASGTLALLPAHVPSHLATSPQDDTAETADLAAGTPASTRARGRFLPVVEAVRSGGEDLADPKGRRLPPCIVMEKGESLYDWSERAEPDLFTSLAVLSNISTRMADMHDAGFVHRDLKPANVMWLPRENRWTVIDFGCVARVNAMAPLSFTLAFAAPEVIHAYEAQQSSIRASPALDSWSLGIMAFELLTGSPAFRMLTDGRAKVMAQLRGAAPLPWEGEAGTALQRKLGAFKGPVLQLLQRDPAQRASMRQFHDACMTLFASVATVEA